MMKMKERGVLRHLTVLAVITFMSGCAIPFIGGYGPKGLSREAFAQYVEDVFRLQNQMTSEAMMLLESDEVKNPVNLILAEQHMRQMCADLNEYASRDMDGLSIGLFLRHRVEKSAIDCEQAALALKALINP